MEKKLLIVGAGGHGRVVKEIAEDLGYDTIDFLDDNFDLAIGKINDIERLSTEYTEAFCAIGNNSLRLDVYRRLKDAGYHIPKLIHPSAYVSRNAVIMGGTIVEPKAIVNTGVCIEEACIISVGAIIDHDVSVGMGCHINAGSVVSAGTKVENLSRICFNDNN